MTSTKNDLASLDPDALSDRVARNIGRASGARIRSLFREMNPHLVEDARFERYWTKTRIPAAVLAAITYARDEPHVVLTVRSPKTPSHAGQIALPGGRAQPEDANATATALREAEEEIALPRDKVRVIGELDVHEGGLGYAVTPVIGVIDGEVALKPCPREVSEIFTAPLSFVGDLANHVIEERERDGVPYKIFAAPFGRYHIWGLTAGILRSLAEILEPEQSAS